MKHDDSWIEELKNMPKCDPLDYAQDSEKKVLIPLGEKLGLELKDHWLAGWCPVQAEGCVRIPNGDWHTFYFRARGNHWRMIISRGDKDAYAVYYDKGFPKESTKDLFVSEEDYGDSKIESEKFLAGYMPENDTLKFIEESFVKWMVKEKE